MSTTSDDRARPRLLDQRGAVTGASVAAEPEAEHRARNESVGEMFSSLAENLSTLVRQEIDLAKAEATLSARQAGRGVGFLAGAAIGGFFLLMFLSMALMWALGSLMPVGWATLIVAVLWGIIAAVLALMGKKHLEQIKGLPQTQETVQEIPDTLNPSKETP